MCVRVCVRACVRAFVKMHTYVQKYKKHKKSNWITNAIVRWIPIRDQMYKRLKQMPIESILYDGLKTNLRNYNNILKKSINLAKKTFYQSCFEKYRSNIKTWSTIKEIIDSQRKLLPESFSIDGLTVTDKRVTAKKLSTSLLALVWN